MSVIINLFAGPSAGKSSIAAGLLHELKRKHISCDAPYEFPKILAWDNNGEAIKDQLYVLANQHRGISKSYQKVKYIVVDSPILLSLIYKNYYAKVDHEYPSCLYRQEFDDLILSVHGYYDSVNVFLERSVEGSHNNVERYHNQDESLDIDTKIKEMLNKNGISYHVVPVNDYTISYIITEILKLK